MGNGGVEAKQDRGGKRKTPFQLQSLEKFYSEEKYPKQKAMEEYAESLGLTYNQVRVWFSERRRKEKRESASSNSSGNKGNVRSFVCLSGAKGINKLMGDGDDCAPSKGSVNKTSKKSLRQGGIKAPPKGSNLLTRKPLVRLQPLFYQDYILKKVFRKDGPPLGVEFDPLPERAFGYHTGYGTISQSCQGNQRVPRKRKVPESSIMHSRNTCNKIIPAKKYGIGKGLMTIWHATNPDGGSFPPAVDFNDRNVQMNLYSTDNTFTPSPRKSNRPRQRNLVPKPKKTGNMIQEKRKPLVKKRKVSCSMGTNQKKSHSVECRLAANKLKSLEQSNTSMELMDDEELELSELQAGPNPLRCSVHLTSNGRNGCPLCKDMLGRFPPQFVKMKQPICTRPWVSSPELVRKLFKVFRFLYTSAFKMDICPFTLDEFVMAFHNKDSLLLGKINMALLKLLLSDVEREISSGVLPRASKDCRFLGFLHSVKQQNFDVNFWIQSLNPLTWIEILRHVSISAGFGSKHNSLRRGVLNKEMNRMAKYGLRPHTLKGELFSILSEQGSRGSKVSELARSPQIVSLSLPNTTNELELLIYSALSSDITLFEKIGPSAFRLRVNPATKNGLDASDSESDDSGSIDDDSEESNSSSSSEDETSDGLNSVLCVQNIARFKDQCRKKCKSLTNYTEIDESFSGEAWVLGLMEGEYSDLSIEEKLDALVALVDLTGAGSTLRMEEPTKTALAIVPDLIYHGSGGKIKKSSVNQHASRSSRYGHTTDTEEIPNNSRKKNPESIVESGSYAHSLQSINLGSDRRYNSYWLFLGPCDASDPGHRRVYFESSEDGHWEMIDTEQDLSSLLSALDCRGAREAHLLESLEKRETFLSKAMSEYLETESGISHNRGSDLSDADVVSGDGSSPVSDVDNNVIFEETTNSCVVSTAIVVEHGKKCEEKKLKWDQLQAFDKWIWISFYSNLNAVKHCKRSYHESLIHCESCHDLYWRDEKHCKKCHTTFELDFDLEEKYAVHVATCRVPECSPTFLNYKVLPSQLQVLKASVHAIEAAMPKEALVGAWRKSSHKLWGKRLRRTSSLPEFLQVVTDFVGAINEEWLYENALSLGSDTVLDDIIILYQTMPQTTSAVALWLVKLDALIAPHLERSKTVAVLGKNPELKRRRACTL